MKMQKLLLLLFILASMLAVSGCAGLFEKDNQTDAISQQGTDVAHTQAIQHGIETIIAQTQNPQFSVGTMVAQTLTAVASAEEQNLPTVTLPEQQAFTPTVVPTLTPTLQPTALPTPGPTSTSAFSVPTITVSVPTNCRIGPGKAYEVVSILDVGKKTEVVGRNTDSSYWVVENPAGSGTCWLWGYYATVSGQTASLPIWEAPPTPTPSTTGVLLKVSVPTNCRVGPGKIYDKVSILYPGKTVEVVGKHQTDDFWVVENPDGVGTCWVWGYYATISGSISNVPVWDTPAAPTPMPVTLTVRVDTNCRVGPGKPYEIVTILRIGKTAEVIARNADSTFWVINNPYDNGNCWVWDYYATVSGPVSSLPVWNAPPLP